MKIETIDVILALLLILAGYMVGNEEAIASRPETVLRV